MAMERIPVIASADDLEGAIAYGEENPSSRWYIARRAMILGRDDVVPESWVNAMTAAYTDPEQREKLADQGKALPDGSFPIPNVDYLKRAIHAYGRAKNKPVAKRHIIKRARALGAEDLLPEGWISKAVTAAAEDADELAVTAALAQPGLDESSSVASTFEEPLVASLASYAAAVTDFDQLRDEIVAVAASASSVFEFAEVASLVVSKAYGEDRLDDVEFGDLNELIQDVVEDLEAVVAAGVRRVRTPEGARFYGQPIGSVIVPNTYLPAGSKSALDLKVGDYIKLGDVTHQIRKNPVATRDEVHVSTVSSDRHGGEVVATPHVFKKTDSVPVYKLGPKGAKATLDLDSAEPDDKVDAAADRVLESLGKEPVVRTPAKTPDAAKIKAADEKLAEAAKKVVDSLPKKTSPAPSEELDQLIEDHAAEREAGMRRLEIAKPPEAMTPADINRERNELAAEYIGAAGPEAEEYRNALRDRIVVLDKFTTRQKPVSTTEVDDTIRAIESGEMSDKDFETLRPALQDAVEKKMSLASPDTLSGQVTMNDDRVAKEANDARDHVEMTGPGSSHEYGDYWITKEDDGSWTVSNEQGGGGLDSGKPSNFRTAEEAIRAADADAAASVNSEKLDPGPEPVFDQVDDVREALYNGDLERASVGLDVVTKNPDATPSDIEYASDVKEFVDSLDEDGVDLGDAGMESAADDLLDAVEALKNGDYERVDVALSSAKAAAGNAVAEPALAEPAPRPTKPGKLNVDKDGTLTLDGEEVGAITKRTGSPGYSLVVNGESIRPPRGKTSWTKGAAHAHANKLLAKIKKDSEAAKSLPDLPEADYRRLLSATEPRSSISVAERNALLRRLSNDQAQKVYDHVLDRYINAYADDSLNRRETMVKRLETELRRRGLTPKRTNARYRGQN